MWNLALLNLASAAPDPSALPSLLSSELERSMEVLSKQPEPPHYVSIGVEDWRQITLSARDGTLGAATDDRARYLDIDLRTGTPALDSTHPLRGFSALADDDRGAVQVPLDGADYALRHALWTEIDRRYRTAAERIVVLRANQTVKVEEEDPAPDFEPRAPVVDQVEVPDLVIDRDAWTARLVDLSQQVTRSDLVHRSSVTLEASRVVETFVDTEGTSLVHGRRHARISLVLQSTASDGDDVVIFESRDVHDPATLPTQAELSQLATDAVAKLQARLAAPRGEPYSGPVLLEGKASAVFFHEVLGHRVEGHRQKREDEGKTFAEQVGKSVLPAWLDVYDDPTLPRFEDTDLNGHYRYDDEGVLAARAPVVSDGIFVGFLMGRSPIAGFENSNGHGRRSTGRLAEARMGNTIVDASQSVSRVELRRKLVDLVKKQGLPYGYVVDEIEGGFTMTGRVTPNAFNVRASTTWRVFADGRPDELIRGIDLVGTPLVAFNNLVAAGDDPQVFNGTCGSDSGWVPVSGVAPSLLFSRLEFQLKEKGQDRPPLLVRPSGPPDGAAVQDSE